MKRNTWMKRIVLYLLYFLLAPGPAIGQSGFYDQLADSTFTLTYQQVRYDPGYYSLAYPGGDVPEDRGVCTDVVIRAYRKMGIDLQKEGHEDMARSFKLYPDNWGMQHPDKNIDHRRVPNLMTFFRRHGIEKVQSTDPSDYAPGDIVCWDLGNGIHHIGIVVNQKSPDGERNVIVHNIGAGQVAEDCLFRFRIIGHYQYKK